MVFQQEERKKIPPRRQINSRYGGIILHDKPGKRPSCLHDRPFAGQVQRAAFMPYMRFVTSFAASPPSIGRKASTSAMMISSKERATVLNTGFRKGT